MLGILAHRQVAAGDNLAHTVLLAVNCRRQCGCPADFGRELGFVHTWFYRVVEVHADFTLGKLRTQRINIK
ncbi:hypothetical protein D3C80_1699730 [compost metagenome]